MSRIEVKTLTPEQQERLPEFRDRWLEIGLSTEHQESDRRESTRWIQQAYEVAGLKAPPVIWLTGGPISGLCAWTMLAQVWDHVGAQVGAQVGDQVGDQVGAQVGDQVRDQVGAQVGDQVRDQVGDQIRDQVRDQVGDQVGDQVRDQVGAQVRDQVRDQVGAQVGDQVGDQVRDQVGAQVGDQVGDQVRDQVGAQVWAQVRDHVGAQVWDQVWDQAGAQVRAQVRDQVRDQVWAQIRAAAYGSHDANWLGFYDYFRQVCSLSCCDKLIPLTQLAHHCGWWFAYQNVCIATAKPTAIHFNEQQRLHNPNGLAICYDDGWGVYAINGRRCPAWVCETKADAIPITKWADEQNVETRLAIEAKIGPERILKEMKAQPVHTCTLTLPDRTEHPYSVLKMELQGSKRLALEMLNPSTGETHREWVPPDCDTVEKALAFRNGTEELPAVLT